MLHMYTYTTDATIHFRFQIEKHKIGKVLVSALDVVLCNSLLLRSILYKRFPPPNAMAKRYHVIYPLQSGKRPDARNRE